MLVRAADFCDRKTHGSFTKNAVVVRKECTREIGYISLSIGVDKAGVILQPEGVECNFLKSVKALTKSQAH